LTRPARGASFRLIVMVSHVSMGRHFYRTVREDISIDHQELAEGHLTRHLFGQILGRIERRGWHPTCSRTPREDRGPQRAGNDERIGRLGDPSVQRHDGVQTWVHIENSGEVTLMAA